MKNQDYEQKYYDLLYEHKKLKQRYDDLYVEYKILLKSKDIKLKQFIIEEIRSKKWRSL